MQHKFQWNVIFSIFTTHGTLRLRFRSPVILLLYTSDPYVCIFRKPDDGFWLKLKHVVWRHRKVCLWVTASNPPFIVKSFNSRRFELSWTKVAETSASGDKSACCSWCSVRCSSCNCVNLLSVSVVVSWILRPRVALQVSLFFSHLLTALCIPCIQSKPDCAVATWNKRV